MPKVSLASTAFVVAILGTLGGTMSGSVVRRFQDHDLWSSLEQVDRSLSDIGDSLEGEDPEAIAHYRSLSLLVEYTRQQLNSSNPELASTSLLDPISQAINQINRFLNPPGQQRNRQKPLQERLSDAWSNSNSLLIALSNLPTFETHEDVEALSAAIQKYHETVESSLSTMQTRIGDLEADLEKVSEQREQLSKEITEQKGFLSTAIEDFTKSASEAQTERDDQYDKAIAGLQKAEKDAATKAEEQRKGFASEFNRQSGEMEETFNERNQQLDKLIEERKSETAETVGQTKEQLEEAKQLVGMISEVTVTAHYQRNAAEQKRAADRWRWATAVTGMAAVASAGYFAIFDAPYLDSTDWIGFASRLAITLTLLALATFFGAQSRSHRRREELYTAFELELANLDPFLRSLPPGKQEDVKTNIAYRFFKGYDRDSENGEIRAIEEDDSNP